MKVARIYMRVSSESQDLERQEQLVTNAKAEGYYIAGIYREKASGARADRPELLRLINDLQPGEVVISEKLDRISRLPLQEAEILIQTIKDTGAKLCIPGVMDLSDLVNNSDGMARIVLESVQAMLLKLALQSARDDYEDRRERQKQGIELAKVAGRYKGRQANEDTHNLIIALRKSGESISDTAIKAKCSEATVKRVWRQLKKKSLGN